MFAIVKTVDMFNMADTKSARLSSDVECGLLIRQAHVNRLLAATLLL
jgi:hypothetical protein